MTKAQKIGLKLERMAYELRMSGDLLRAEGLSAEQREFNAIIELMASLGERLNPTEA